MKKQKRIFTFLLVSVLLFNCMPIWNTVSAASTMITDASTLKSQIVAAYLNKSNVLQWGSKVYMSTDKVVKPYSADGATMMPVEFFVNSLGGTIEEGDAVIATYSSTTATFSNGSAKCTVNGVEKPLSHKAEIGSGDKLYAPITDLCDIFGIYLHEEINGLIFWSKTDVSESFDWSNNTKAMREICMSFLYDDVTGAEIASTIESRYPNNAHPRLVMTQDKFDTIRNELKKGEENCDPAYWNLYTYIKGYADEYLNTTPGPYELRDGVRLLYVCQEYQEIMLTCAMLYNITDDEMLSNRDAYAQRAYDQMIASADFTDWNPDHFLDVGHMSNGMGICYDWLYNWMTEKNKDKTSIVNAIYNKGIVPFVNHCDDPDNDNSWDWRNGTGDNWCFVVGNVGVASMAVFDELSGTERTNAERTMFQTLEDIRQPLSLFAPYGAYEEGNGYWGYAMQYYTWYMSSLISSTGKDYGYVDVPGMNMTNKFIMATSIGSRNIFSYHDNSFGSVISPTMFLADYFNKPAEAQIQISRITSGYKYGAQDAVEDMCLYNKEKFAVSGDVNVDTDVYYPVSETAVMRTGFDVDDTYLGFHCDDPYAGESHDHMDAGTFVLDSMEETWFFDLGKDDYNLSDYLNCYRVRAEGHNTVVFNPSSAYGMKTGGKASIVETEFGTNGGYAIGDMSEAYESNDGVEGFRRGTKLDKRNGIVTIQDEIKLSKNAEMYWFAHTKADIEVAEDGKSAILTQHGKKLKAIIVKGEGASFSVMDAVPLPTSPVIEGQDPNIGIRKLTIHMDSCKELDLSVVFVGFESEAFDHPEYFNFVPLDNWDASDIGLNKAYSTTFKNKSNEFVYNVSADITATEDGEYRFFAASYSNDDNLLGYETMDVVPTEFDTKSTLSAKFDLSDKPYISSAENVKFMLWDMNDLTPCMKAINKSTEKTYVEVARGKRTGGSSTNGTLGNTNTLGNIVGTATSANSLVDGNPETGVGFYANVGTKGNLYVDLGTSYKISYVEVLSYNKSYGERAGNFSVVASNEVTDGLESTDKDKTILGYALPAERAQTGETAEYRIFKMPVDSADKEYRYISLEKFEENGVGMTVAEIKVYVDEDTIPKYIDVTDLEGVTTGAGYNPNGNNAYNPIDHNPHSRLIDEIETDATAAHPASAAGAGFYYNVRTGYMYVDLGNQYKIHHIEVVAYDNLRPKNCSDYNLIVTNTLPDLTPYDAENPGTDLLVATPEYDVNATTPENGKRIFYVPETDTEYQYVSFEQFTDKGDKFGLLIQEVRVFVDEEDMPVEEDIPTYIEVAQGKTTGGKSLTNSTYVPTTENIVDNDIDTRATIYLGQGTTGYMYVDLGRKYKIDHVEVMAYDATNRARAGGYDVILGNSAPDDTAFAENNNIGEIRIADNVPAPASESTKEWKSFSAPGDEYQYVILERFDTDSVGMMIAEVKVYVCEDDMPTDPVATNVALGKGATGGMMSRSCLSDYDDLSVVTDGALCVGGNSKQIISYLGAWYCLDLGESYDIEKVMLDAVASDYSSQVSIYLSDQPASATTGLPANKTTILDGTANTAAWGTATKTIDLNTSVNARYVIVYRPSGASGNNLRIGELEVWGVPAQ